MKTLRQYLGILIAAILLFFLIKPFVQTHSEHVGIETTLGGLIVMPLVFSKRLQDTIQVLISKISGHVVLLTLACLGILACLVFLIPSVSKHVQQFQKVLRETGIPLFQKSFRKQWVYIFTGQVLLWFCQVFAFFLFVKSLVFVQWNDFGIFSTCYAFAWLVGFLSFLTPGGLGVREGLLGLLLANYMPTSQATLIALLCRVWMLSAEIVLAGVVFFHQLHSDKVK